MTIQPRFLVTDTTVKHPPFCYSRSAAAAARGTDLCCSSYDGKYLCPSCMAASKAQGVTSAASQGGKVDGDGSKGDRGRSVVPAMRTAADSKPAAACECGKAHQHGAVKVPPKYRPVATAAGLGGDPGDAGDSGDSTAGARAVAARHAAVADPLACRTPPNPYSGLFRMAGRQVAEDAKDAAEPRSLSARSVVAIRTAAKDEYRDAVASNLISPAAVDGIAASRMCAKLRAQNKPVPLTLAQQAATTDMLNGVDPATLRAAADARYAHEVERDAVYSPPLSDPIAVCKADRRIAAHFTDADLSRLSTTKPHLLAAIARSCASANDPDSRTPLDGMSIQLAKRALGKR